MSAPAGRCRHCAHCQALDKQDRQLRDSLRMLAVRVLGDQSAGFHWAGAWRSELGYIEDLSYYGKPMVGVRNVGQVRTMLQAMAGVGPPAA